jgi:ankyrin repeat protein
MTSWRELRADAGVAYYYNKQTQEVTWSAPPPGEPVEPYEEPTVCNDEAAAKKLIKIIEHDDYKAMKRHLKHHPNTVNAFVRRTTPLTAAIARLNVKMVSYLLKQGANPRQSANAESALAQAVATGDAEIIAAVSEAWDFGDMFYVDHAIEKQNLPLLTHMMRSGAHVTTAQVKLACSRCVAAVPILIDGGAPIDAPGKTVTPLMAGRDSGTVALLVRAGADVCAVDEDGQTALHYFVTRRDMCEAIYRVLDAGARVNAAGKDGRTALHIAVDCGREFEVVALLLACGADPNRENSHGDVPLNYCRRTDLAALLFAAGAKREKTSIDATKLRDQIKLCKAALSTTRHRLVHERAFEIALALQELALPALLTVTIVDGACRFAHVVPFHVKWSIATTVKHFKEK